ncbi:MULTISPECIES: hypothetical protein [Bacillaceae]|uniref:Uncharacterized protein n=1 Tax=Evansella alkalicola TaxID=745819 RepID=A0ABS6JNG1_9BACI|nr:MULTISPECIES: hypothetical protein [Bacillaceae]MBU9720094.1 hypothetical protein [Bacillus alkalicola]
MVINEKMLHDDLYEIMLKQVKEDLQEGLFDDHLLTLWNMSSKLRHLNEEQLMDLWVKYRVNYEIQKLYSNQPEMFGGFKKINGEENVDKVLSMGGLFLTFHYGHDRFIPITLADKLNGTDKYLHRILDEDELSNDKKYSKWKGIYHQHNIEDIVVDDISTDSKVNNRISKKDSLIFYLDGKLGFDDPYKSIDVKFLSTSVSIPTSIFRVAVKFHKPVCLLISETDANGDAILTAYEPLWIHDDNIEENAKIIYQLFENKFLQRPESWRKWDQLTSEIKCQQLKKIDRKPDVVNRWGTRGFNFRSGKIYEIAHS